MQYSRNMVVTTPSTGSTLSSIGGTLIFVDSIFRFFFYYINCYVPYTYITFVGSAMDVIICMILGIMVLIGAKIMRNPDRIRMQAGAALALVFSVFSIFWGLYPFFDIFIIFGSILGIIGGLLGFMEKPRQVEEIEIEEGTKKIIVFKHVRFRKY